MFDSAVAGRRPSTAEYRERTERQRYEANFTLHARKHRPPKKLPLQMLLLAESFPEAVHWLVHAGGLQHWRGDDARALLRLISSDNASALSKRVAHFPLVKAWTKRSHALDEMREYVLREVDSHQRCASS